VAISFAELLFELRAIGTCSFPAHGARANISVAIEELNYCDRRRIGKPHLAVLVMISFFALLRRLDSQLSLLGRHKYSGTVLAVFE